jgi:hypothetical protein
MNDTQKPCETGEAVFATQMLYFVLKVAFNHNNFFEAGQSQCDLHHLTSMGGEADWHCFVSNANK